MSEILTGQITNAFLIPDQQQQQPQNTEVVCVSAINDSTNCVHVQKHSLSLQLEIGCQTGGTGSEVLFSAALFFERDSSSKLTTMMKTCTVPVSMMTRRYEKLLQ